MPLQRLFFAYLICVHLVVAGIVIWFAKVDALVLVALETGLLLSLGAGAWLLSRFFAPLGMLRQGADMLRESDFSSRIAPTGQSEMDTLIAVFNAMLSSLREERLKTEEQRHLLGAILEQTPTGIIICDFDGRVGSMNPSAKALLGDIALGTSIDELPEPFSRTCASLLGAKQSEVLALGIRRVRCTRIEFFDRGFARSAYLFDEMTEELRRSEKAAYDKLIRIFAHEINNSAGAVRSILQSVSSYVPQLDADDRADVENALRIAIDRTSSLAAFIKGYADIVRLPAPNLALCDIVALVRRIADLLSPTAAEKQVLFDIRSPQASMQVMGDTAQLEQVLLNICKNAIEASNEAAQIIITVAEESGKTRLTVENTGVPIPPEIQNKLFTPFFTTKPDGQGIGLMLVRDILTAHNISFALDGTSNGARFTMIFP
ncbi:MAG: ATP-binding protein [Cyanobacteriota bacterium]|nr:ATP-binding protein [Cyanobacteriota bacterium]